MKMVNAEALNDEQLAGQALMVGFQGETVDAELRFMIAEMHVGGLILFKRNISRPLQLAQLCDAAQAVALESGNPPLVIAIDQEGGPVARLGPPFTVFSGNRAIGQAGSEDAAREFGRTAARELKNAGITANLAPVLDVTPARLDSYVMSDRVFGEDPWVVADLGKAVIQGLQENGVIATAKHFPGLGRSTIDPHEELPHIDMKSHVLELTDLFPFQAAVQSGVAAVMLAHAIYRDLDPLWPASLSSVIADDLLRGAMGFEGVTITDDLDMGAIDKHVDLETVVERICDAQIDTALICHNPDKMRAAYRAFLKAIRQAEETKRRRIASVQRILDMKAKYAGQGSGLHVV